MTKMRECPLTIGAKQMATGDPSANLHFGRRLLDTRILVGLALIHHTTVFVGSSNPPLSSTTGLCQNRGFYPSDSSSFALPLQIQLSFCQGQVRFVWAKYITRANQDITLPLQHQLKAKFIGATSPLQI
jgi:hypothetical protein